MTSDLSDAIIDTLLKGKVKECEYINMIRDLIKFFDCDLNQVFKNNVRAIFDFTNHSINSLTGNKAGNMGYEVPLSTFMPTRSVGHIFGEQLEGLLSMLRLQRTLVESAHSLAK